MEGPLARILLPFNHSSSVPVLTSFGSGKGSFDDEGTRLQTGDADFDHRMQSWHVTLACCALPACRLAQEPPVEAALPSPGTIGQQLARPQQQERRSFPRQTPTPLLPWCNHKLTPPAAPPPGPATATPATAATTTAAAPGKLALAPCAHAGLPAGLPLPPTPTATVRLLPKLPRAPPLMHPLLGPVHTPPAPPHTPCKRCSCTAGPPRHLMWLTRQRLPLPLLPQIPRGHDWVLLIPPSHAPPSPRPLPLTPPNRRRPPAPYQYRWDLAGTAWGGLLTHFRGPLTAPHGHSRGWQGPRPPHSCSLSARGLPASPLAGRRVQGGGGGGVGLKSTP